MLLSYIFKIIIISPFEVFKLYYINIKFLRFDLYHFVKTIYKAEKNFRKRKGRISV